MLRLPNIRLRSLPAFLRAIWKNKPRLRLGSRISSLYSSALGRYYIYRSNRRHQRSLMMEEPANITTVALYIAGIDARNAELKLLDKLIDAGLTVIALPKGWIDWRRSGERTRTTWPADPDVIIELEIAPYPILHESHDFTEDEKANRRSAQFMIFHPNGRLIGSGAIPFQFFSSTMELIVNHLVQSYVRYRMYAGTWRYLVQEEATKQMVATTKDMVERSGIRAPKPDEGQPT